MSGGLHGVGVSVVNALSEQLDLRIWRDGKGWSMRFRHGDAEAPLAAFEDAGEKRGTEITFLPSKATFSKTDFDYATLEHRLRELAFLNSGVRLILIDARGVEETCGLLVARSAVSRRSPPNSITKAGSRRSCVISTAARPP